MNQAYEIEPARRVVTSHINVTVRDVSSSSFIPLILFRRSRLLSCSRGDDTLRGLLVPALLTTRSPANSPGRPRYQLKGAHCVIFVL